MGEIIVSLLIGGFLVVSGIAMNVILGKEEKRWKADRKETPAPDGEPAGRK